MCQRAARPCSGSLTTEQDGQLRVCWCSLSMACSLLMGAEGPALGKGPPPPRVSAHFRICAIILQHRPTSSNSNCMLKAEWGMRRDAWNTWHQPKQ